MPLQDYRPMMERCSNCLNCRWVPFDKLKSLRFGENCPSVCYYGFGTYSARGRFQLGQSVLDGEVDESEAVGDIIHSCLACGACDVSCKVCRYNLEPLAHNLALKEEAVSRGWVKPAHRAIMEGLRTEQTMLPGRRKADRTAWQEGLGLKDVFQEKAEVLFFPGCKYAYEEDLREKTRGMVRLMQKAGVDLGVLGSAEACCGGRAADMGYADEARERVAANCRACGKAGVTTVVTPCADCLHAFKRQYAEAGATFEVLHVTEYLERLVATGALALPGRIPMTVTYHDPCKLGRQGEPYEAWNGVEKKIRNQIHTWDPKRPRYNGAYGVYDAPRRLLEAIDGVRLVEMERIREYSWCCGASGGCEAAEPEFSAWTASERVTEARATGAAAIATACPWCKGRLGTAVDENGDAMPVVDIVDLVLQAAGEVQA